MAEETKTDEQTKTTPRKAAPKVKHLDGCPGKADRVEQYETNRINRNHTTTPFVVTRCLDCGAHEAKQK